MVKKALFFIFLTGLCHEQSHTLNFYNNELSLISSISDFTLDKDENLWIGSNNGLVKFDGLNDYDITKIDQINFKDLQGEISGYHLIGGNNSIYKEMPKNYIIKYNGKEYSSRIYVTTRDKISKENCNLEFKINNSKWILLKQCLCIDLISFLPGKYKIHIRGCDILGRNIVFKPITVIITENFFESNLFFILVVFLFTVLISLVFWLIITKLTLRNKIYQKVNMDLHDEIGTILSKTSLLLSYSKGHDKDQVLKYIKQANYGLKVYINNSEKKYKRLIILYFKAIEIIESSMMLKNIKYDHSFVGNGERKINCNLFRDIKLCLYEIFNNTIKYSSTDHVSLFFEESHNLLKIKITEKNNFLVEGIVGNGLSNITKRIKRNGGKIIIENNIKAKIYVINIEFKL